LRIEPSRPLIALVGVNGAGKTNLLEAISLLMPGKGLRGADFAKLARLGGPGSWAVSSDAQSLDQMIQLGTAWQGDDASDPTTSRVSKIDGLLQRSVGTLAGLLRILWLTPAMDRLFSGSPGERRRFLDRAVTMFDPEHSTRVTAFDKLMRERNLLLQDNQFERTWLASIELQMAEVGVAIAHARLDATASLGKFLMEAKGQDPFPWGILSIKGETEELVASRPAVQAEEQYRMLLEKGRPADRAAGRALVGPHRSDLMVFHGPKNMSADSCSTGEQKALLIGLILAQARAVKGMFGAAPILLLDEVAAHLDKARRTALFQLLVELGSQTWMTGTEAELFDGAGASAVVYQVENGTLAESIRTP
jgi:DNA replication and repair protein RecF